jgi:limonene-1,2-epoxide hydrolase
VPDSSATARPTPTTNGRRPTTPREVVKAFLTNISDLDAAFEYVADDIVYENIGTFPLPTMRGSAAARRFLETGFKLGSDFKIEIHKIAADGPIVMTERTDMFMFGKARAGFWVCGVFEVRDGKIVAWRDYFDNGNVLLGVAAGGVRALAGLLLRR